MSPLVLSCALLVAATAPTQLTGMFAETTKDFGNVPRGSLNVHRFEMTNTLDRPVRVGGVRVSCNCTAATAVKDVAAPGEKIVVEAKYNTTSFSGTRTVTVYVSFIEPYSETVSLRVTGFSRQDIVLNPGQADFGVVARGAGATKVIDVEYAGGLALEVREQTA
ncbi:MAG: DUF1573 domain-containing protein, partial [Planctomycetia bacterium]